MASKLLDKPARDLTARELRALIYGGVQAGALTAMIAWSLLITLLWAAFGLMR